MLDAYFSGFLACLGLILAIGAQNAFLLRQGIMGEHVLACCLACVLSDVILISIGVGGFETISRAAPWVLPAIEAAGCAFLIFYGARSLMAAASSDAVLVPASGAQLPLGPTLAACLAITWLNPHVYLDTVVLLGALSLQHPGVEHAFAIGAISASTIFLFTLGFGARLLRPIFATPAAWRMLEVCVALMMWGLAAKLIFD
ncbi:MAG: LysE/ArgO family amino acid transporter [Pseudomonadota bacterium]